MKMCEVKKDSSPQILWIVKKAEGLNNNRWEADGGN